MNRPLLLAASSLLAVAFASPALAQDADEGDTIMVTAQLREQSLVDVPIALTAYEGEFLDRLGISDFEEISRHIPGFEVQNQSPNNPGFVMRGITSDTGAAFGEPRVSVYQDGVSISKSRGSYVELFDLERVEVARGPQSTLYGRGALIGAVNLVQNKADPDAFDMLVRGGLGNFDAYSVEGMVNAPLGTGAAARIAGRLRQRDGYVENALGGEAFNSVDTMALRGALRLEPSQAISIDLIGNYQEDKPAGTSFKSFTYLPTDPTTGAVLASSAPEDAAALAPAAGFEGGTPLGLDREVWGVTGLVNANLTDRLTLTSITAYREFAGTEIFDADGISLPVLTAAENAEGEQLSQELRLVYQGERVTAFVGAAYFWEDGFQRTPAQFDERVLLARLAGALQGPVPGTPANRPAPLATFGSTAFTAALLQGVANAYGVALAAPLAQGIAANLKSGHLETSTNSSTTKAFDVFADVTLRLTDRLELGAGARFTHDDKESAISAAVLNGRSILGGFIGALGQPAATRTALLGALAVPGAATIPTSATFPVPLFGLGAQPTANNGDTVASDLTDEGFTWRFTARYELSPASSLYASYARGRRPELLSAGVPAAPLGAARFDLVEAETVDSFEVGAKSDALAAGLYLDGALFYYKYKNFQTTVQEGTQFITTNAGEAESYGAELQARWRADANVELFATYAYNHSRFEAGIREGNRFRLSPDHTASFGLTAGFDAGPGRVDFTPSVTYQSEIFFDDDNDRPDLQAPPRALVADLVQDERQGSYALVNARLGYTLDAGLRIEAFVTNLLDQDFIKDAGNTGDSIGLPTFIAGEPRMYGVQASARF
ncbi:MAG: TonB-dependent receptor [Sphingomonadales bacterium 12-68-11]|nr:MAG: TonB-dependent receptor [Sphingomonadales bacterium 12-68-11]